APVVAPVVIPKPAPAPVVAPVVAEPEQVVDAEPEIKVAKPLSFSGFFETDGNNLSAKAKMKLDKYVDYLNAHPTEKVVVTGYTDDRGAATYNQQLSEKRAKAVKAYLTSNGINANRITTKGMGESNPVADNNTADGRAQNRRVELDITN
ncbi:MAG: OmpA family protein, partial [Thiotrichales bacterium]|nr:OmpA family protein [Thiotrichales bacterium]